MKKVTLLEKWFIKLDRPLHEYPELIDWRNRATEYKNTTETRFDFILSDGRRASGSAILAGYKEISYGQFCDWWQQKENSLCFDGNKKQRAIELQTVNVIEQKNRQLAKSISEL